MTTANPGTPAPYTVPGFEVLGFCGRKWFVPREAVVTHYADFLVRVDGLALEEARERAGANEPVLRAWFSEAFTWEEVELYGVLVQESSPRDIEKALNFLRLCGGSPARDAKVFAPAEAASDSSALVS